MYFFSVKKQNEGISLSKAHRLYGADNPISSELVSMTMRGIARIHGKPQRQVSPLLKEDLIAILSTMQNDGLKTKRDKALLLIGFCGAFRRSELVSLKTQDLEFTTQGIIITLPRSKTDQTGLGRKIAIPYGKGKICPVLTLTDWMEHKGSEGDYIFPSISKGGVISQKPLSDRAVCDIVKHYVQKIGLEPSKYAGHSLRAGLCTSAFQHGFSSIKIRQQTGHRTDAMLARYIRDGELFSQNAASLF